jgi:four helix bundle protein
MFVFEKFPVYLSAEKLYLDVVNKLKHTRVPNYLRDQLERALASITLNIAEGAGKYGKKGKRNFYLIARGSCHESAAAIRLLRPYQFEEQVIMQWVNELEIIGKMLSGLVRSLE